MRNILGIMLLREHPLSELFQGTASRFYGLGSEVTHSDSG